MPQRIQKSRSVIFSADEVRATLAGRKTQFRRVVKCECNSMHGDRLLGDWGLSEPPHQWDGDKSYLWHLRGREPVVGDWIEQYQTDVDDHACRVVPCPFGVVGDRLLVKETWCNGATEDGYDCYCYKASGDFCCETHWRSPVHMPLGASRLTPEVTGIRVERLQDISEADATDEGVDAMHSAPAALTHRTSYAKWWNKNCKSGPAWKSNPWVWVVTYRRISPPRAGSGSESDYDR